MSVIAQQFGKPHGMLGRLAGAFMTRHNGGLNRWAVRLLTSYVAEPKRILEVGPGPGLALRELSVAFSQASIIGVDPSPEMCRRSQSRTQDLSERVHVLCADLSAAADLAPVDLVLAVHVLYFWHDPELEAQRLRALITPDGVVALGYQLREHMPRLSRKHFPRQGHRLYDSDAEVADILRRADLEVIQVEVKGKPASPAGRLLLATPTRWKGDNA